MPLLAGVLVTLTTVVRAGDLPSQDAGRFPLHLEPGRRHLVDAQGQPFLLHGDTPWLLITEPTREQAERYLEDRRRKGFNAVLVELIENAHSTRAPANIYGVPPFLVPGDVSTPNDAYFDHAAWVIGRAAEKGILVLLTPAYLGYEGRPEKGWYRWLVKNSPDKLAAYGRYLARRFAGHPNILWVHGGDYDPPDAGLIRTIAGAIHEAGHPGLHTVHGAPESIPRERFDPARDRWFSVNNVYAYEDTLPDRLADAWRGSRMPFFLIESRYEGEHRRTTTDATIRRQAWQACLGGAFGHLYGDRPLWRFDAGWEAALDAPGAVSLVHLRTLLESIRWWTLTPDHDGLLLVDGRGAGRMQAAAAITTDGSVALLYFPGIRDATLDLGRLRGPRVRARWYDPSAGRFRPLPHAPWPAAGRRVFNPGIANSSGRTDWVLLLESVE